MNNLKIKICGIKSPELAAQTVQAGADYIGLIFEPSSKRYVDINLAKQIAAAVIKNNAVPVAVFTTHTAKQMLEICNFINVTTVQLHGDISQQQHNLLPKYFTRLYVHGIPKDADITRDYLLLDKPFDINTMNYTGDFRLALAGGLNINNIKSAITKFRPHIVDLSSGVEDEIGNKSIELIKQFIDAARGDL
ncbi:MAG TPA: phosphoribosylanthranilate isomerase [Gammaproteobacteria bacterium]|nr:phosphoribosylanthranilate isomerase [Gammaproteobacteria bacterium]